MPADLVLQAFQAVPKDYRAYSLAHHPLTDLNEQTARSVIPIVERRSHIHFFGHVHQPKPATTRSSVGECFLVQGGALYESEGHYNGYSILRTSEDNAQHTEAQYHTYYVDRQEFDVGTNVVRGGTFFNSDAAQKYFELRVRAASNDAIAYWLIEHTDAVVRKFNATITNRNFLATFVEPLVVKPKQGEKTNKDEAEIVYKISDVVNSTENIVIAADHEYGATSLLQYICMYAYQSCAEMKMPVVPVFLDARRLKPYANAIASAVRAELPDSADASLQFSSLYDSGRLVALIDDFDPTNTSHLQAISVMRSSYPKMRLIIAAKLPLIYADHLRPVIGVGDFIFLQIRPLTRSRVRLLIDRWKLPQGYDTNSVIEEITARFRRLGIPLTPTHVVIYLSILEDVKGYNPINSSSVIEQFVEGVLDKYKPDFALRATFDYRNQVDYLAAMAGKMVFANIYSVEFSKFATWTSEYFESIGIEQDCKSIVEMFFLNKIFSLDAGSVSFRHNIYLSYFIAQQMIKSKEFKSHILADQRYAGFVSEIDLYCGLSRIDDDLLDFLGEEFERYNSALAELVAPLAWDAPLEMLQLPRIEDQTEFAEIISQRLSAPPPSAEQRDRALEEGPQETTRPALQRPDVQGILPNWIMSLRAYTVALKNLENLPKQKKEAHLTRVLDGWATVLRYSCLLFRELIASPEINVGPMKFTITLPSRTTNELLRMIFLSIPTVISHWVRNDLGSQKLELQLKNEKLAPTIATSFLQTGLFADMKLNGYMEQLSSLHSKLKGSQFFLEALIIKMRDIYVRFGLTSQEQKAFQHLAAELSADAKGLKGKERTTEIGRFAQRLERGAQLSKLRDDKR